MYLPNPTWARIKHVDIIIIQFQYNVWWHFFSCYIFFLGWIVGCWQCNIWIKSLIFLSKYLFEIFVIFTIELFKNKFVLNYIYYNFFKIEFPLKFI
jgi:hypothetical protein